MYEQGAARSTGDSEELSQEEELWLSGSKASRHGWVRVSDGRERVFYHSIKSGKITLERPVNFGGSNPTWADGERLLSSCCAKLRLLMIDREESSRGTTQSHVFERA